MTTTSVPQQRQQQQQPPTLSESTALLAEAGGHSDGYDDYNYNSGDGSKESDNPSFSFTSLEVDDNGVSALKRVKKELYYYAMGFWFLVVCLGVRILGSLEHFTVEEERQINSYHAYGSLVGDRTDASLRDGTTYRVWEEYLMEQRQRQRSSSPGMAAAGSLLGTATSSVAVSAMGEGGGSLEHDSLLYFNSTTAFSMLDPSAADFYRYQNGWEAQITQALCAVATSAALLNSLRDEESVNLPIDPTYQPFHWATQKDILAFSESSSCVYTALGGGVSNVESIYHMGLGHAMIPHLLNCFLRHSEFAATGYEASDPGEEASIKETLIDALAQDTRSRVLLNYDRGGIGQELGMGHGHWSPLGGYDPNTDRFLIMDVAKYKHPMVWVTWTDLWQGAHTVDSCGQTLSLDRPNIDWSLLKRTGPATEELKEYMNSRCVPGHRGFVVVTPSSSL